LRSISRRRFLLLGLAGAASAGFATGFFRGHAASDVTAESRQTLVVSRRNGTPAQMVRASVEGLGGMHRFIQPGERVAIKVNGSWNNPLANVDPEIVKEVVLLVREQEPSEVVVYDHTINRGGWKAIAAAASEAGARAVELRGDSGDYVSRPLAGKGLKSARIARVLDEADALINLAKLKTHSSGQVTISLKNHLGSVLDRGSVHDGGGLGLHQGIADVNTCEEIREKQRLTICDAIRPMVTGGPSNGSYADYDGVLAGTDPVATDHIGTQIIRRYNPKIPEVPQHVARAADLGLGTREPSQIAFDEGDVGVAVPEMGLAAGLAAVLSLATRKRSDRPSVMDGS